MVVEVRRGEERRRLVAHQRLLVELGRNPEDDDVPVALAIPAWAKFTFPQDAAGAEEA